METDTDDRLVVRSYRPGDRPAVRELACDTADQGEPIDPIFEDREVVADVLTRYYTDWEPQSLWVAECDRKVVGYLTGCLDTRRNGRVSTWRIVPRAVLGAMFRGALLRPKAWRLIAALTRTFFVGGTPRVDVTKYPAHFHINIREGFRDRGIGRRLVARFRQQVEDADIRGIHIVTRGDNESGRRFFESMGFHLLREQPLVLPQAMGYVRISTVVYGWMKET